jgi:hypothetical protein
MVKAASPSALDTSRFVNARPTRGRVMSQPNRGIAAPSAHGPDAALAIGQATMKKR